MHSANFSSSIGKAVVALTSYTENSSTISDQHEQKLILYRTFQVHPNWSEVRENFKWAWPLHSYGFASVFLLLSSYTFISILTLRSQLPSRPFVSTINIFVLLLGLSRCICLYIDPYHSAQRMPIFIGSILWQLGYPCMLSALGLTQLAFNSSTKLSIGLEWFRSQLHISTAAAAHFSLILLCCILPTFHTDSGVLYFVTQSLFIFWGLLLCSTFFYSGWRFLRKSENRPLSCSNKLSSNARCQPLDEVSKSNNSPKLLLRPENLKRSFNRRYQPSIAPKIRITDEFDHTLSYTSESPSTSVQGLPSSKLSNDNKLAVNRRYSFEERVKQSTEYLPRRHSSSSFISSKRRLSCHDSASHRSKQADKIDLIEKGSLFHKEPSMDRVSNLSSEFEIFEKMDRTLFDSRWLRKKHVEKLLQKIVIGAAFGIFVNISQSCLLYGPFGITEGQQVKSLVPWFIFTSAFRFVELILGFIIASVARQPLPTSRKMENEFNSSLLIAMIEPPNH